MSDLNTSINNARIEARATGKPFFVCWGREWGMKKSPPSGCWTYYVVQPDGTVTPSLSIREGRADLPNLPLEL